MSYLENPTKEAIEKLCKDLNLPRPDAFSQDWAYETSYINRIEEFIIYYHSNELDDETKFTLMMVMIDSSNDALDEGNMTLNNWEKINSILVADRRIHLNTIKYWMCEGKDLEDSFSITPYIRKVGDQIVELEKIENLNDLT